MAPKINYCPKILTTRSVVRYLSKDLIIGNKTKNFWSKIKYVTTKTAGERGVLACEHTSGRCSLHMDSGVEIELSNPTTCTNICGFVLDVEVIKCPITLMPSLIVAFDILQIDASGGPDDTLERYNLLRSIVDGINIKGLISKPIYPAANASELWESVSNCPYPVNGLVFLKQKRSKTIYKWKPVHETTIRVVLYKAKEGHRFLPYIGPENYSLSYYPFYRFASTGIFEYSFRQESTSSDEGVRVQTKRNQYEIDERNKITTSRLTYWTRECTIRELQNDNQLVEVPSHCVDWAAFQIIDVGLDIESGVLYFRRHRRDKKKPYDIAGVDEVIQMHIQPLDVASITEELKKHMVSIQFDPEVNQTVEYRIHKYANDENLQLIPDIADVLAQEVLSYIALHDLVPARRVSKIWRRTIDLLDRDFSKENKSWMEKSNNCYGQVFLNSLTMPSIGFFLHFGGRLK